jgi:hypothetical protein
LLSLQSFSCIVAQSAATIELHAPESSWPAAQSRGERLGRTSVELRYVNPPSSATTRPAERHKIEKKNYFGANPLLKGAPDQGKADPVIQVPNAQESAAPQINPLLNMDGLRNTGANPPDPTADVGRNHYIQMANSSSGSAMRIFNKQGNELYDGPSSDIWSQVNTGSIGDPVVQYDHSADRWFIMEMQGENELLIAVSVTPDPLGAWDAYRFQTDGFPDYPKLYIWPDALFVTVNEILDPSGNQAVGYALEKSALLASANTFKVFRFLLPKYAGIAYQPSTGADWESGPPPPPGSPGYVFRLLDNQWTGNGSDQIDIWEINVDWANPSQSVSTGPKALFPAPFESNVCYGWLDCIDQPGTNQRITALDQIIMYRAPYRNFGDYESVVFNHVSDITNNDAMGGIAGVRWYEVRKYPNQAWKIHQQGTYAPSQDSRFTGMLTMDGNGNIALGYSICSPNVYPSIGITGRNAQDPLGVMSATEFVAAPGLGFHDSPRWGDYCNMSVDPVDDRTFWFTAEYQPQDDYWATKIIAFQLQKDTFDVSPYEVISPLASPNLGTSELVKVKINNYGQREAQAVSIDLYLDGNLVVSEQINQVVPPDGSLVHVFGTKIDLSVVGRYYQLMFITKMTADNYSQNDTLRQVIRKLTSADVGLKLTPKYQQEMCSNRLSLPIALYNASAITLNSVQINYKLNNGGWQNTNWSGVIAPFATDTIFITIDGLVSGPNQMRVATSLPNGVPDQDTKNDSIIFKLPGFVNQVYHYFDFESKVGHLAWEISKDGNIIATGATTDPFLYDLCLEPNQCYDLRLAATNQFWVGRWSLLNDKKEVIYYTEEVLGSFMTSFCVADLKSRDIGPWQILEPRSESQLTQNEPLAVRVRNYGTTSATNIPITVQLDQGQSITEMITAIIPPGALYVHRFQSTFNLSEVGRSYAFRVTTSWPSDSLPQNDTIIAKIKHLPELDLAFVEIVAGGYCSKIENGFFILKFKNEGSTRIDSVKVQSVLNGVTETTAFVVTLDSDETKSFTLLSDHATQGLNTVSARLIQVNKESTDFRASNNAQTSVFEVNSDNGYLSTYFEATKYGGAKGMSWTLTNDADKSLIAEGKNYPDWQTNGQESICLDASACYTLTLRYPGATGWPGTFELSSRFQSIYVYRGAAFQDSLVYGFCGLDACAALQLSLDITPISSAGASDGRVTLHGQGGQPPYFYSLNGSNFLLDSTFRNLTAGSYVAQVVDITACKRVKNFGIGTSNTQETIKPFEWSMSPNPAQKLVRITVPDYAEPVLCILRDAQGKMILSDELAPWDTGMSGVFSIAKLPTGLYFVTLYTNGKAISGRLIKG